MSLNQIVSRMIPDAVCSASSDDVEIPKKFADTLLFRNLEYAAKFAPVSEQIGCVGRLDYIADDKDGGVVIRGGLAHRTLLIRELFLSSDTVTVRAYAHSLSRQDVAKAFHGMDTLRYSGFVAYFAAESYNRLSNGKVAFRVKLSDGTSRQGTLMIIN